MKEENYKELIFDMKTYWKIFWVTIIIGSLTVFSAFKEHWTVMPLGLITLFLFGIMKVCTIIKKDACVSGDEQ